MENSNKTENQSERLSLSSDQDMQDSRIRPRSPDPCQICGSVGLEGLIITCFRCREVREHTYCARVPLPSIPDIWLCEVCRSSNGITQTTVVEGDCTLKVLAINAFERGANFVSEPENSSCGSWKRSHKTTRLRTHVEDKAEAKHSMQLDFQTSARDSICIISASGHLALHTPSEGLILQSHTSPEVASKEARVLSKDTSLAQEQRPPFEAFPPPSKKRRTLRLTGSADIGVKTIA